MLVKQLRLAFSSLNGCFPRTIYPPLICDHVTRFKITPSRRPHSRFLFDVHRADTNQLLFRVLRTSNGFRLVNARKKPLYYATWNEDTKGVQIKESNSDNVLFTTHQKGQFFSVIDVFHGDACDGMPLLQVCGTPEYELTENESGRVLALVRRVARWHQAPACFVHVDTGLNAAVFMLLITTINESSHI